MKISSNVISPIKYETIKLKDKESGKELSFKMKSDEIQKIEKKVFNVKSYLQTMFEQYQESGNIDSNSDGYLDAKELITSKRFVKTNIDSNKNITFSISSLQDIVKDDKKATQIMEDILKDSGYSNGKLSLQKDFFAYISADTNRDTNITDKEIFKDIGTKSLSATFKNFLLEQILAMIKKNKDKVLNGITEGAFNGSLDKQSKVLDKLMQNNENVNSLSNEDKSIFSSTKESNNTINIIDLLGSKEKSDISKKYLNTQTDSAKVFSLKI